MALACGFPRRGSFGLRLLVVVMLLTTMVAPGCRNREDPPKTATREGKQAPGDHAGGWPRLRIVTHYPGLPLMEMEELVTVKVERALMAVEGVREVRSHTEEGKSTVDVVLGAGLAEAEASVRDAVERILSDLPAAASQPEMEMLWEPTLLAAVVDVYGDADPSVLGGRANELKRALQNTTDAFVRMTGDRLEMQIEIDPERLRRLGLNIEELIAPAAETNDRDGDEVMLQTQGRESILLEVFAPTRHEVRSTAKRVQSAVDRLRPEIDQAVKLHVVDCSSASRAFAMNVECPGMPARSVAEAIAGPVTTALRSMKEVSHVHTRSSLGHLTARIEVRDDRDSAAVLRRMRDILDKPGCRDSRAEPFPPVSLARIDLHGKAAEAMLPVAHRLRQDLLQVVGVARVDAPVLASAKPELQFVVNRKEAARYGLTAKNVSDQLRASLYGDAGHVTLEQMKALVIRAADGTLVRVAELVELKMGTAPLARYRLNGQPTITLDVFAAALTDSNMALQEVHAAVATARQEDTSITIDVASLPR